MIQEKILAFGHKNILGTHKTTIEITKDSELTKRGNCIIGVNANKSCADLSENLKKELKRSSEHLFANAQRPNKKFEVILRAGNLEEKIIGYGSENLILTNKKDIVLRKSSHIDDRTLLIKCDKACADLSRGFINKLKNSDGKIEMSIFC